MKNKWMTACAALVLVLSACHKESDKVYNYAFKDELLFAGARQSFGEMFKIVWNGLNTNYAIWDYEKEKGLDWDAVYEEYYPKFCALDSLDTVADADLQALAEEAFGSLHDGHLVINMDNWRTGGKVRVDPGTLRVKAERGEEMEATMYFKSNLTYYAGIPGELLEYKSANYTSPLNYYLAWVGQQLAILSEKEPLTEEELALEAALMGFMNELKAAWSTNQAELINRVIYKYKDLGVPGLDYVDEQLLPYRMSMNYALFSGNIAYLSFNSFSLTPFLAPEEVGVSWTNSPRSTKEYVERIRQVWNDWFYAIQRLHKEGKLGGVIIDVRSNGGGFMNDYKFVLGALVPSGGLHVLDARYKRGTGRYDYSPLVPMKFETYPYEHETITEPIVVLANCNSVSMAEVTSMGTKVLDNAVLMGTRTFGGLCALTGNEEYNYNYSGHVGVEGETPVFCYTPSLATFSLDGHILEGVGVTPDIEVAFDKETWADGAGPDSQIDRALEYIRTRK